jgi:hypothetical protein
MKTAVAVITAVVFGLLISRGVRSDVGQKKDQQERKALVVVSGANSKVSNSSLERITTAKEWAKAWARHLGTTEDDPYRPNFDVDFEHCLVVAIFRGNQVNTRGVKVESIAESADRIRIRFKDVGYQTVDNGEPSPPDRPYAFVVVPKTDKAIVLEEDVQSYKDHPPVWEQCGKLSHRAAK